MSAVVKKFAPSVPAAMQALTRMEVELRRARTYRDIHRIVNAARVLKSLMGDVVEVKQRAERVVLVGNVRIGEEIRKIPKASGGDRKSKLPRGGNLKSGRGALDIPGTSRSRLGKLADLGESRVLVIAEELHKAGKDATVKAILGEQREIEIKTNRAAFEARRDRGARIEDLVALADRGERFPVIYADPPWEFKVYSGKGKQRSAERYYDTDSIEAIKSLPIAPLAADNACLFLWAVWPELPGAIEVIKAWGFEYKTAAFVWIKQVSDDNADLHTGMGYWTRANSEACLFATRGSPQRHDKAVHQIINAPIGAHSEKPEIARERIERLVVGPYLELFARCAIPGWTVWGNEIAKLDEAAE